jgi:hypothetical protein
VRGETFSSFVSVGWFSGRRGTFSLARSPRRSALGSAFSPFRAGHTLLPVVRTKRCVDGVFPKRDDLDVVASDSTTTREPKAPSVREIESMKRGESRKDAARSGYEGRTS